MLLLWRFIDSPIGCAPIARRYTPRHSPTRDRRGGEGIGYDYSDDVTCGAELGGSHMWWEIASGDGKVIYEAGPPVVNHKDGTNGTCTAPDYKAGSDLRVQR